MLIIKIPIIKNLEPQPDSLHSEEYCFNNKINHGGLACGYIWNTIVVSFNSNLQWDKPNISIQKKKLDDNVYLITEYIEIKYTLKVQHINNHQDFFIKFRKRATA